MLFKTERENGEKGPDVYAKNYKSFLNYIGESRLKLKKLYESKEKPTEPKKASKKKD